MSRFLSEFPIRLALLIPIVGLWGVRIAAELLHEHRQRRERRRGFDVVQGKR